VTASPESDETEPAEPPPFEQLGRRSSEYSRADEHGHALHRRYVPLSITSLAAASPADLEATPPPAAAA